MTLSDIRDYIETLTQGAVYVGPIPDKPEKMVGVYNSKHQHEYKVAIGGTPAGVLRHEIRHFTGTLE